MKFFNKRKSETNFVSFNSRQCKACWKCVEACKQNVFNKVEFFNHRHAKIISPENCTGCCRCVKACNFAAITLIK